MARVAVGRVEGNGDVVIDPDAVGFLFLFALAKPIAKAVGKAVKKGKLLKVAEAGAKGSAKGAEQGVKARAAGARDDTSGSR